MSLARHLTLRLMGSDGLAPALRAAGRGLLSMLMLHRFADPDLGVEGTDPAALRDQLAYLRRHRYQLLSMADMLKRLEGSEPRWAAPAVAFTVDDGYAGFANLAAPIFAEYDCPVTLFVTTGFLDGKLWLWWDRTAYLFGRTRRRSLLLHLSPKDRSYHWSTATERLQVQDDVIHRLEWVDAPEREAAIADLSRQLEVEVPASPPAAFAPITWDDVRRTARLGATFGPHTVTPRILSRAPDESCDWEIQESYRRLHQETDASVPVFCYPNGEPNAFGQRELEAVQRAGLKAAVTTVPGYITSQGIGDRGGLARFALPRFGCPADRPHLVYVVSGLMRFRAKVRHAQWRASTRRKERPAFQLPVSAAPR